MVSSNMCVCSCVVFLGGGRTVKYFIQMIVFHYLLPTHMSLTQDENFDEIAMADAARKARLLMKFKVVRTNASVLWEIICSVKNRTETCHHCFAIPHESIRCMY